MTEAPREIASPDRLNFFESIPESSHFKREQCQAAGEYSAKVGGRALLILVDDRPVYQRYEPGWARWKPHLLGSASQCLVGLAAAVAVQEGLMTFDEPVSETITEWRDDPTKKTATIRQLLTQSSGIEPGDASYASTYQAAIAAPFRSEPGKTFAFGSNAFQVFGELLSRKLAKDNEKPDPMGYAKFLTERIFKPLQMEAGPFLTTENGEANVALGPTYLPVTSPRLAICCAMAGSGRGRN